MKSLSSRQQHAIFDSLLAGSRTPQALLSSRSRRVARVPSFTPAHLSGARVRFCEGFRMPADDGRGSELRGLGPAFENLQGRKSREGIRRRCGALYGDLAAARGVADGSRWG